MTTLLVALLALLVGFGMGCVATELMLGAFDDEPDDDDVGACGCTCGCPSCLNGPAP